MSFAEPIRDAVRPEASGLGALVLLIPAWQPGEALAGLVGELVRRGFGAVVVVDDGSSAACGPVFAAVEAIPGVHVLRHAVNWGKGRALKTGMDYVLAELPGVTGLVTADCDGQHTVEDVVRVGATLDGNSGAAVLGVRALRRGVPLRSRVGNALTRWIFARLTSVALADTQTGLRAFPRAMLAELVALEGERYEYEMSVLAWVCRLGRPVEVPIATVYFERNRGSHFKPLRDSLRIFSMLLRYSLGGTKRHVTAGTGYDAVDR